MNKEEGIEMLSEDIDRLSNKIIDFIHENQDGNPLRAYLFFSMLRKVSESSINSVIENLKKHNYDITKLDQLERLIEESLNVGIRAVEVKNGEEN